MTRRTPKRPTAAPTGGSAERQAAIASFERGDYRTAAPLLVSLLARTRPDPLLLRLCGMALLRCEAGAQGLPYLAQARRLAPQDPLASLWHGIALQATGRPGEAVEALAASAAAAPSDPAPLIHLSRALMTLQRPAEAVAAAGRAAGLAPSMLEAIHALRLAELVLLQASPPADASAPGQAWLRFGLACLRLDKVADARAALRNAVATPGRHPEAAAWLALVEHLCGEPAAAIARLRTVLDEAPDCVVARLLLAGRLVLNSEPGEALALLDRPAPPDPSLRARWQAWRVTALMALARHRDAAAELARVAAPLGEAEIVLRWQQSLLARAAGDPVAAAALADRAAQLASDPGLAELEDRIETHFVLADLRAAEGRRDQAFGHWRQGHALLRAAQPFSRATHAATLAAVTQAFNRDRLTHGARSAHADAAPVFIVGLPRTGTTLAEQILSAHAAVHGGGERLAIRETLMRLAGTTDAAQAAARVAALDAPALTEAAAGYLDALHALSPSARIVIDKMPDNVMHLGFIATLLPGARVICCTRDLRDVGASIFQQRFLGHHPYAHDLADLGWYMAQHNRLLAHWRDVLSIPMLTLDHADWIIDFDATLRRVLAFLDLPWDPACERFFEQERTVRTASREQVRQPINARGVGRWRAYAAQLAPMLNELPATD